MEFLTLLSFKTFSLFIHRRLHGYVRKLETIRGTNNARAYIDVVESFDLVRYSNDTRTGREVEGIFHRVGCYANKLSDYLAPGDTYIIIYMSISIQIYERTSMSCSHFYVDLRRSFLSSKSSHATFTRNVVEKNKVA